MDFNNDMATLEKQLCEQAKKKKAPVNGSLELLPLCNMNCNMCYVRLSREEMDQQGRLRTIEEWMQIGQQMQQAGVLFLLLTGGEPLLYPGFKELYLGLKKMGMILTINTNGTLIDDEWAAFFGKYKPRRVNITLYGSSKATYQKLCHYSGGFEKAMNGIHLLKQYGVDVKISGSLTEENYDDMNSLIDIADELDIPIRIDTYMVPAIRERNQGYDFQSRLNPLKAAKGRIQVLKRELGTEVFRQYVNQTLFLIDTERSEIELSRKMSCYAGQCSFSINWQGEMRPCVVLDRPSVPVFKVGFEQAWKQIVEEVEQIFLSDKCSKCRMRPLCDTCAACALLESGSYDGIPVYMCDYTKESLRLLRQEAEEFMCE